MSRESFSVVIAGAGPTGLALGNLLGAYGLDTLLVERNAGHSLLPRAISLDDEGLRVCQALGLFEQMRPDLLLDLQACYLSGKRLLATVAPTIQRNGHPLISTFYQPAFEATLLAGLQRFPAVEIRWQTELQTFTQNEEGVVVTLCGRHGERYDVACRYLLACDGAKSTVRAALRIPLQGTSSAQRWLVVDAIDDPDVSTTVRFFCNPARPAVSVPAPGGRRRWEFLLLPGEQEQQVLQPERVQALIRQQGGPVQPQIVRTAIYTFHALLARSFQQQRVFLLGDAAHQLPPFGGQGLNCGLRDAHNLAWKLWLVLQGQAGPALLTSYTLERRVHTRQLIGFSRLLGAIIMPTARPLAGVRDAAFALANCLPTLRTHLSQAGIKPEPRYPQGFFLRRGLHINRLLGGLMLPQPRVDGPSGLDDLLSNSFALLHLNSRVSQPFAAQEHQSIWRKLKVCQLVAGSETCAALSVRDDLYLLVRPDRYIYAAFRPEQSAEFAETFARALHSG